MSVMLPGMSLVGRAYEFQEIQQGPDQGSTLTISVNFPGIFLVMNENARTNLEWTESTVSTNHNGIRNVVIDGNLIDTSYKAKMSRMAFGVTCPYATSSSIIIYTYRIPFAKTFQCIIECQISNVQVGYCFYKLI